MPFPAKLPKNAWASPIKNEKVHVARKASNNNQSNMIKYLKNGDQIVKSEREVGGTSLPYLSSPPPQKIKISNNNGNRFADSNKIGISHKRP